MKLYLIAPFFALALGAQQSSVSSSTAVDINGHRIVDGPQIAKTKSPDGTQRTELLQSINGRMVPIERVEERVLRDDSSGKVVERIIRRYDPQGNPTTSAKETIEEQKYSDGSSTTQKTTYRGDINGSMQVIEKSVTQATKSSSGDSVDTVVERPTVNGSLGVVEKQTKVTVKDGNNYRADEVTQRTDGNGGFYTAVRKTTEHSDQGSQATDNTAEYEATSAAAPLQLHSQSVATIVKNADGTQDSVVNIFGQGSPGVVASDSTLRLQEQQVIQTTVGSNGSVVQTVSVRRPSVSDPKTLGPAKEISQTVCQGTCKP